MLDIKFIRENPEKLRKALKDRDVGFDLDYFLGLDEKRRAKIKELDDLRAEHNKKSSSEEFRKLSSRGGGDPNLRLQKVKIHNLELEMKALEEEFNVLLFKIPNVPENDVPVGSDESKNKVIREVGEKRKFDFKPKDYMEIALALGLIDTERASKASGSRFGYIMGKAVLIEIALVQYAFEKLSANGFIPVVPPVLIKEEMMRGMGYIDTPQDLEERYFLEKDRMFLVGTSEQSLGAMHANETIDEDKLPLRYAGFSTCFRREAGSYGKDTHGILRVHQFDKVEMFIYSTPEKSKNEHQLMLKMEEELMKELEIPYRVVQLCTGDLSRPSASTFDIEAWLPGQAGGNGQYRETHSTSNTTDFQARRLGVKVRRKDGKTEFLHMLNGTAFAIGRMIIAILENYQQEDGSILVPKVLQEFTGFEVIKSD